ncbi:MAG: CDP-diacylglycerol--serine O-phosphatidyltransferase [Candidatus Azotimanducaceae bacterium]|jgi:CDP-diacylglycerol--serine O-phosphatidyltransferase
MSNDHQASNGEKKEAEKDSSVNAGGDNIASLFELEEESEAKEGRAGLRRGIYLLPNSVTTGALFSGFYAIIAAMSGSYENAAIAIIVAGFLDALDGRIARMTNTQSEFGVQYDSLSDMVAFGVAPAVLMFSWVLSGLGQIGWVIAFLYMACAALRLARFNTKPDNRVFFGLNSPMAAGVLAAMVWVWSEHLSTVPDLEVRVPLALLTAMLALLMVSNVPYFSPKKLNTQKRAPFIHMLGVIVLFAFVAANPPVALLILGVTYAASGPIQALMKNKKVSQDLADS